MKIGFVIPSRLKSTRLPGKNLLYLGEQTAIGWAIDRARRAHGIDEVVVATTPLNSDADITKVCCEKNIRYFQGDAVDVLKRLRDTAEYFDFDYIVNITPDNTLFSVYMIDMAVAAMKKDKKIDYLKFRNVMLGTGIYGLKREALQTICEFKEIFDTEIWGSLFHEKYFNIAEVEVPSFLRANYRLTMDTPEDYKLMNRIYSDLKITKNNIPELEDVILYLDKNPQIAEINSNIRQSTVSEDQIAAIRKHFETNEEKFYMIKAKYYGGLK